MPHRAYALKGAELLARCQSAERAVAAAERVAITAELAVAAAERVAIGAGRQAVGARQLLEAANERYRHHVAHPVLPRPVDGPG